MNKSNKLVKWECAECAKSPDYECPKHFRQSFDPIRSTIVYTGIVCSGCDFLRDDIAAKQGKKPSAIVSIYYCSEEMKKNHHHETYLCLDCNEPSQKFKDNCCVKKSLFVPLEPIFIKYLISTIVDYYG